MATDGFLGRWSRRKLGEVKGGEFPLPPLGEGRDGGARTDASLGAPAPTPALPQRGREQDSNISKGTVSESAAEVPLPTIKDAQALTAESDFKPFLSKGVAPDVRNAAMKKLFSDPRYNVMDGLDTYIDDYSKSDPIPESMLRNMASAQFLKLFEDKTEEVPMRVDQDTGSPGTMAESNSLPLDHSAVATQPCELAPPANPTSQHAHPDLRLQPDDAAPGKDVGRSAE